MSEALVALVASSKSTSYSTGWRCSYVKCGKCAQLAKLWQGLDETTQAFDTRFISCSKLVYPASPGEEEDKHALGYYLSRVKD